MDPVIVHVMFIIYEFDFQLHKIAFYLIVITLYYMLCNICGMYTRGRPVPM